MPVSKRRKRKRVRCRHALRRDEQVALMVMAHFPEVVACGSGERIEAMSCRECVDFQQESCPGQELEGWECIACMAKKVERGEKLLFESR
jgi:hypothetical protein